MTAIVVLAAGSGTRLRPITETIPKCLVPVNGKPILEWQKEVFNEYPDLRKYIVSGYLGSLLQGNGFTEINNSQYDSSNMVYSLWLALRSIPDTEVIVSYGDIIFNKAHFSRLLESAGTISIAVDLDWLSYWKIRMDDVLSDAESLIIGDDGLIKDIGRKVNSYSDIHAQFMGLLKFRGQGLLDIRTHLDNMFDDSPSKKSNDISKNLYMTDFIQMMIEQGAKVSPVKISGGWCEIDCLSDLSVAEARLNHKGCNEW